METIKLRQRKKNFLIVHPMKNIWLGNIHRMPKYMYEYLEISEYAGFHRMCMNI